MPRVWGSWSGTSSSGARYRVGFDWSRSGTRVTVDQYVFESEYSIYKDVTLTRTGRFSGSYSVGVSTSGGVVSLGRGGSTTGSRGGSVTIGGRVTDILHGLTCSVSETISIPALPPSTPSRPSVSRVTATSARISWSAPANNGSSIIEYGFRAERGGSLVDGGYTTSRSGTVTGLDPNTRYGARVRARNSAGWSDFSVFRYFYTEVARPNPPSNFTASRVNDERVNLSWSRNATSGAPYDRILIRRQTNTGSWYNLATVSGSATGYTDTSTSYGNSYNYNIRAINAAGQSGYTNPSGGRVYMRPRGPLGNPVAKKQGSNIRVSWDASTSDYTTGYRIYDSPDGGPWVQVGSTSSLSWTHIDPDPSVTHQYRVSSTRGSLEGNQSNPSNTVQLQAPPLAPTLISPGDGVVLPRTDEVDLVWRHESVDTTDQAEYEVAYRVVATDEVTIYTGTTAQSHTIAASDLSGEIRWNARTKGADPAFGPWSPANTFMLASVPSAVIQSPTGPTLPAPRVSVVWSYADADEHPQATWQAELWAGEDLIEQEAGHGEAVTEHEFEARLSDATEYTIRVRVRSGAGLWSDWDETYFTTDFPLPVTIEPSLEWDRSTGAVMVTLATEPLDDTAYAWTGPPGASTSTMSVEGVVVRENLCPNPSFEYGTDGWSAGNNITLSRSAAWATGAIGSWVGAVAPTGTNRPGGAPGKIAESAKIPVVAGDVVSVGAQVIRQPGTTAPSTVRLAILGYDSAQAYASTVAQSDFTSVVGVPAAMNPAGFENLSIPAGVAYVTMAWYRAIGDDGTGWTDGEIQFDAHMIEEGATLGDYFDGDTPDEATPDAVDVERRDAGGEWVLIGSGLDPMTSIVDPTPRLGEVTYRAVSRTALPSESVGPEVGIEWGRRSTDPSVFVTGGQEMSVVCTAQGGSRSNTPSVEQSAVRFAGQSRPTAMFGTGDAYEVSFTGKIVHTTTDQPVSSREEWEALLREFSIVCYRDTTGVKVYGLLSVDFSLDRVVEQVSVGVQRTRYLEGVERIADGDLVGEEEVA